MKYTKRRLTDSTAYDYDRPAAVAIEDSEVVVARHAAQRATDRHPVLHCRAAADRLRDAELQARPLHDGQTWNSQG